MSNRLPQLYRILLLVGIVVLIFRQGQLPPQPLAPADVAHLFPNAEIGKSENGTYPITVDGEKVGTAFQTSPTADSITGYVGSTNSLLIFNTDGKCLSASIWNSDDTIDHVKEIEDVPSFFEVYEQKTRDEIAALTPTDLDAVSGATLTSFAIRRSINLALGGRGNSLKFPDPVTQREATQLIPSCTEIRPQRDGLPAMEALDQSGNLLGLILRTGGAADSIPGYRGPTEAVIALDPTATNLIGLRMRGSYETLEYAQEVRKDPYFYQQLTEIPVADWINNPTPGDLGIEGISGATLTSYALSEGVQDTLRAFVEAKNSTTRFAITPQDWILFAFIAIALLLTFTRLRKQKWVIRIFQLAVLLYLGFFGGHMLAQTLLVGWAKHGVDLRTTLGLFAIAATAFLIPATTGRNLYCQRLCPHGAAQQLLMIFGKRKKISAKLAKSLTTIPTVLLILILFTTLLGKSLNLAALEPFDAYLFPAAGIATVALFLVSLIASFLHPMAYCKFGCPTGKLIETVRFHNKGESFGKSELILTVLFLASAAFALLGQ